MSELHARKEIELLNAVVDAQDRLLAAYRVGAIRKGESASLRVINAKDALETFRARGEHEHVN